MLSADGSSGRRERKEAAIRRVKEECIEGIQTIGKRKKRIRRG